MKHFKQFFALALILLAGVYFAQADSPRIILVEEATNASCGPCASQNPSFQEWILEHKADVIPLIYHWDFPGPNDPMFKENVAMNNGRIETYYGINGVPSCRINGKIASPVTSGWYDGAPGDLNAVTSEYNKFKGQTSPITLAITQTKNANNFEVNVNLATTQALSGQKLRIVVVEYLLRYPNGTAGSNGEEDFYWVARKMLPDHVGTTITQAAGSNKDYSFNVPISSTWNANNTYIIAFVQDDASKEVLQAGQNLNVVKATAQVDQPFLKVAGGDKVVGQVLVTNESDSDFNCTFEIDATTSVLLNGFTATVEPKNKFIKKGESTTLTVTINAPDAAGFVQATVLITPLVSGKISEPTNAFVYALSDKSKATMYLGTNQFQAVTIDAINRNSQLAPMMAYLPINAQIFQAYNPAAQFDVNVITVDYWNRGMIGASFGDGILTNLINQLLNAGKAMYITSCLDYTIANTTDGSAQAKNLYGGIFGLEAVASNAQRFTQTSQGVQPNPFPVAGVNNDEIGKGFSSTANQYNGSSWPYWAYFTDILKIKNNADVTPFLYYDNNTANVGGMRLVRGDSRIVYMTMGLELLSNSTHRYALNNNIITWLLGTAVAKGPEIASDVSSIDFGEVEVGEKSVKSFKITNPGDQVLVISEFTFGFESGAFTLESLPKLPYSLEPGSTLTVEVTFAPKDEEDVTDMVDIKSNAKNGETFSISVNGKGKKTTSVIDGKNTNSGIFSMNVGPNPFAEKSMVNFTINGNNEHSVIINVIDATGRTVAELVNSIKAPGDYSVDFNAVNLASGNYFVMASVSGETVQIPVVITR